MKTKDVKIRCSRLGDVMTPSRETITDKQLETIDELVTKGRTKVLTPNQDAELKRLIAKRDAPPVLSDTCTKYLTEVYLFYKYGRKKDIHARAMEKGLRVEEDSLTLWSRHLGEPLFKNYENYANGYLTGTPDAIQTGVRVRDAKSAWDLFTFTRAIMDPLDGKYDWQLRGYMELLDVDRASLAWCLIDTPEPMIQDAKRRLSWDMGLVSQESTDPIYVQACADIDRQMTYQDIPLPERIREYHLVRDKAKEEEAHDQIERCREWLRMTWPGFFTT